MAALFCCGNQPTPIIIGLLVTYSIGLINCYPLFGSSSSSSSLSTSNSVSPNGNANLGQIVYRPNYNLPSPSSSVSSSSPVSSSQPLSIVAPSQSSQPSASSSSSLPVTVSQSASQPLPQLSPSNLNRHSSLPAGLTLIRGNSISDDNSLRRPSSASYHDYYDTFRLPLIPSGRDKSDLGVANSESGRLILSGLPNGYGNGNKQRFIFAQPSTSPIDFDYVPYIQSDFSPSSLSSALAAVSSGSERNSDLYEEADYNDPVYDLKYDPIQDPNWLNEAISSSYRQTQQQQPQLSVLPSIPFIASSLPDNSGSLASPNSDEYLSNLMLTLLVKELERNAQPPQSPLSSQSSEPVQHSVKLQKQGNVEGLKAYEGFGIEKKSFNRDKGTTKSGENQMESAKRIEQRGQKEYAMLRPAIENNGKDDIDSQSSLSSQLQSVSATLSSTTTTTTERSDEEVNQLRSLLQSA